MIACVHISNFAGAVSRLQNPVATDVLIFVSQSSKVVAASLKAVQAGVRYGMRLAQARTFCPEAVFAPFDSNLYRDFAQALLERLTRFTPRIEVVGGFWNTPAKQRRRQNVGLSSATYFLDLGKIGEREHKNLARQIREYIQADLPTPIRLGMAAGKFPAYVAARCADPATPQFIRPGQEAGFLAPRSVLFLPMEREIFHQLRLLCIHKMGQFARLPLGAVIDQYGFQSRLWHSLANGVDEQPVAQYATKPTEHIFQPLEGAVEDRLIIETLLLQIGCDLESRLAGRGYTMQSIQLRMCLDDGSELTSHHMLRQPTGDGNRIGRALVRLFDAMTILSGVTGIEICAGDLAAAEWQQLELFGHFGSSQRRLDDMISGPASRFGSKGFHRVKLTNLNLHLAEERFQLQPVDDL